MLKLQIPLMRFRRRIMHQSGDSLAGGSGDEELGQVGGRGGWVLGGKGDRNINETSSHCPHSLNCMSTKICRP